MLLASFNTLPLVNLKPELGKSGIGGIGIAGKWVADMLGVCFFFFPLLGRCTVCDQRSAARSTTELIKTIHSDSAPNLLRHCPPTNQNRGRTKLDKGKSVTPIPFPASL